jgi:hypothetical protein
MSVLKYVNLNSMTLYGLRQNSLKIRMISNTVWQITANIISNTELEIMCPASRFDHCTMSMLIPISGKHFLTKADLAWQTHVTSTMMTPNHTLKWHEDEK